MRLECGCGAAIEFSDRPEESAFDRSDFLINWYEGHKACQAAAMQATVDGNRPARPERPRPHLLPVEFALAGDAVYADGDRLYVAVENPADRLAVVRAIGNRNRARLEEAARQHREFKKATITTAELDACKLLGDPEPIITGEVAK